MAASDSFEVRGHVSRGFVITPEARNLQESRRTEVMELLLHPPRLLHGPARPTRR